MNIDKHELILRTGEHALYEYDRDSDMLEIIFGSAKATCAIELTESIILRFDWNTNEPLSLSFISLSRLMQSTKYGEMYFQLLVEEWPYEAREKIWKMLQTLPLAEFLTLSSYIPAHSCQTIPMTTIKTSHVLSQAA